jgi:hypothetical protein
VPSTNGGQVERTWVTVVLANGHKKTPVGFGPPESR